MSLFTTRLAGAALLTLSLGLSGASAQELKPFADTSRLVSIGGSLTEIIYALGEEGKLVARDQTALFPEAALTLPDVGYMRQLAPEGVLSVSPSALLVIEGSGPPEALEVLSHAGVEYQTVPESYSADGVLVKIRAVGQALGVADKAEAFAAEIEQQFAELAARTDVVTEPKRVLFILSAEGGKIQASGTGTAADGIIALSGAVNAIDEYSGYKALTEEAIIDAAPDVILMMDRGGDHGASDADLAANPAIALTPAGQNHAFHRIEGAYLLGFGPRTAAAAGEVFDLLYGAN
ncbi:iron complex transport system substrate-binding protein [Devosia sp. YR412]|uniref:heme/hemin ABC transporter substrate-binding protein n=1 Tax=Devosia sp. YR412 TaxID=1881030 RepID=UPI0008CCA779|nr:ABC transporter substrate-binding protein [Devosia sp. YR412]SEQ37022.1 iron complex transport system substrate-binding protein [Devosia sp. YR412]